MLRKLTSESSVSYSTSIFCTGGLFAYRLWTQQRRRSSTYSQDDSGATAADVPSAIDTAKIRTSAVTQEEDVKRLKWFQRQSKQGILRKTDAEILSPVASTIASRSTGGGLSASNSCTTPSPSVPPSDGLLSLLSYFRGAGWGTKFDEKEEGQKDSLRPSGSSPSDLTPSRPKTNIDDTDAKQKENLTHWEHAVRLVVQSSASPFPSSDTSSSSHIMKTLVTLLINEQKFEVAEKVYHQQHLHATDNSASLSQEDIEKESEEDLIDLAMKVLSGQLKNFLLNCENVERKVKTVIENSLRTGGIEESLQQAHALCTAMLLCEGREDAENTLSTTSPSTISSLDISSNYCTIALTLCSLLEQHSSIASKLSLCHVVSAILTQKERWDGLVQLAEMTLKLKLQPHLFISSSTALQRKYEECCKNLIRGCFIAKRTELCILLCQSQDTENQEFSENVFPDKELADFLKTRGEPTPEKFNDYDEAALSLFREVPSIVAPELALALLERISYNKEAQEESAGTSSFYILVKKLRVAANAMPAEQLVPLLSRFNWSSALDLLDAVPSIKKWESPQIRSMLKGRLFSWRHLWELSLASRAGEVKLTPSQRSALADTVQARLPKQIARFLNQPHMDEDATDSDAAAYQKLSLLRDIASEFLSTQLESHVKLHAALLSISGEHERSLRLLFPHHYIPTEPWIQKTILLSMLMCGMTGQLNALQKFFPSDARLMSSSRWALRRFADEVRYGRVSILFAIQVLRRLDRFIVNSYIRPHDGTLGTFPKALLSWIRVSEDTLPMLTSPSDQSHRECLRSIKTRHSLSPRVHENSIEANIPLYCAMAYGSLRKWTAAFAIMEYEIEKSPFLDNEEEKTFLYLSSPRWAEGLHYYSQFHASAGKSLPLAVEMMNESLAARRGSQQLLSALRHTRMCPTSFFPTQALLQLLANEGLWDRALRVCSTPHFILQNSSLVELLIQKNWLMALRLANSSPSGPTREWLLAGDTANDAIRTTIWRSALESASGDFLRLNFSELLERSCTPIEELWSVAIDLLSRLPKPPPQALTTTLQLLSRAKSPCAAAGVWIRMCSSDDDIATPATAAAAATSKVGEAERSAISDTLTKVGTSHTNERTIELSLNASLSGEPETNFESGSSFSSSSAPKRQSPPASIARPTLMSQALQSCANAGMWEMACHIFESMVSRAVEPNVFAVASLRSALTDSKQTSLISKLVEMTYHSQQTKYEAARPLPSLVPATSGTESLGRIFSEQTSSFSKSVKPANIEEGVARNHWSTAVQLLSEYMRSHHNERSEEPKDKRQDSNSSISTEAASVTPDSIKVRTRKLVNDVVKLCNAHQVWKEAIQLLNHFPMPSLQGDKEHILSNRVQSALLNNLAKHGRWEECFTLVFNRYKEETMKKVGQLEATSATHTGKENGSDDHLTAVRTHLPLLLKSCRVAGHWCSALEVGEWLRKTGTSVSFSALCEFVSICLASGFPIVQVEVWLRRLAATSNAQRSDDDELSDKKKESTSIIASTLFEKHSECDLRTIVDQDFSAALRDPVASSVCYALLVAKSRADSRAGSWEVALHLFDKTLRTGMADELLSRDVATAILGILVREAQFQKAFEFYRAQKLLQIPPKRHAIHQLLTAYTSLESPLPVRWSTAMSLLKDALAAGSVDRLVGEKVAECVANDSRWEEALYVCEGLHLQSDFALAAILKSDATPCTVAASVALRMQDTFPVSATHALGQRVLAVADGLLQEGQWELAAPLCSLIRPSSHPHVEFLMVQLCCTIMRAQAEKQWKKAIDAFEQLREFGEEVPLHAILAIIPALNEVGDVDRMSELAVYAEVIQPGSLKSIGYGGDEFQKKLQEMLP